MKCEVCSIGWVLNDKKRYKRISVLTDGSSPQRMRLVQGLLAESESKGVRDEVWAPEPHSGGSGRRVSDSAPLSRTSQVHGSGHGGLQGALPAEDWTKRRPRPCSCGS